MSGPDVCEHGMLSRCCERCEDGARIAELEAQLSELQSAFEEQVTMLDLLAERQQEPVAWQPIETAPKDGTRILVFTVHGEIEISEWFVATQTDYEFVETDLYRRVVTESFAGWNGNHPTHWMPLPRPPLIEASEKDHPPAQPAELMSLIEFVRNDAADACALIATGHLSNKLAWSQENGDPISIEAEAGRDEGADECKRALQSLDCHDIYVRWKRMKDHPPAQEPVAWMMTGSRGNSFTAERERGEAWSRFEDMKVIPLYARPPAHN